MHAVMAQNGTTPFYINRLFRAEHGSQLPQNHSRTIGDLSRSLFPDKSFRKK